MSETIPLGFHAEACKAPMRGCLALLCSSFVFNRRRCRDPVCVQRTRANAYDARVELALDVAEPLVLALALTRPDVDEHDGRDARRLAA